MAEQSEEGGERETDGKKAESYIKGNMMRRQEERDTLVVCVCVCMCL